MTADGISDSLYRIHAVQIVGQVPSDDHPAVPVNDCGEIHMGMSHFNESDIDRPCLIRKGDLFSSQKVWEHAFLEVAFGEVRLWADRLDAHLLHETADELSSSLNSFVF